MALEEKQRREAEEEKAELEAQRIAEAEIEATAQLSESQFLGEESKDSAST
jgi:hypothetical protein